ncbi:MAG: CAP domain-containing protein [Jatrophihabitans sp.]|uniref:CAP domain-containing protein n=1 Tax=Jatrophihabitans sp. TaxID=1932789 RepID=UPI003F80CEEE
MPSRVLRLLSASRRRLLVVLALVAALLGPLVTAPAQAGAMVPIERVWAGVILRTLNLERALHGLPALHVAPRLVVSARRHDLAMARANTMSHQLPGEAPLTTRVSRTGYRWHWVGENVAWNSDISAAGLLLLQHIMYNELPPENGHRLNILSPNYKQVGIDVYIDRSNGKVWMTEDFGAH